jgi:hypothetical protein
MTARSLDYATEREAGFSEYLLENGVKMKARVILMNVVDTGRVGPNGLPIYDARWQVVSDCDFTEAIESGAVVSQNVEPGA